MSDKFIDAEIWPEGSLEILSQFEVDQLQSSGSGGLYPLLRRCMLAVLNSGSDSDDARGLLETYRDFEVGFVRHDRGLKVTLENAPAQAFVDGYLIRGTRELLSAVLRDIVFTHNDVLASGRFDLGTSDGVTNAVFHIVRNAELLKLPARVNLVVCWGGHAISREEYDYTKTVGYELGLRGLQVCRGRALEMAMAAIMASSARAAGFRPALRKPAATRPKLRAAAASNGSGSKSASACWRCACRAERSGPR